MADPSPSDDRVLVAYATKHGSTREVADAIATTLQEQGLRVDLKAADTCPTLEGYGAVVLGGALYMGHWHKDARRFIDRYHDALATMPLAIFAMGPKDLEPSSVADARRQLDPALKHLPEPGPIAVEIVGGVIDPSQLHFPSDGASTPPGLAPFCRRSASMTLDGMR